MKIFLIALLHFLFIAPAFTQNSELEKRNDAMAQKVIAWLNNKDVRQIYAAFDSNMRKAISKEDFYSMTEKQLYPLAPVAKEKEMGLNGATSVYLLKTAASILTMQIAVNQKNEITGLFFAPAKTQKGTPVADNGAIWHDNALQTPLDSLVHQIALQKMQETKTPGMSIGILSGQKAYYYNYGEAKLKADIHPLNTTIFEIGSITKTFTAFILADAVVSNRVNLNDAITKFLPAQSATNKDLQAITLLQLANHTSGLPRLPSNAFEGVKNMLDPYADYDSLKLFKYLQSYKTENKPGEKYEYSNLGFGLLGVILENVYQQPLEELYQQIIFAPFKMKNSYATRIKDSSMTAVGYDEKGTQTNYWNFASTKGAGSIKSNTEDLLKYALQFTLKPRVKGKTDARVTLLEQFTFQQDKRVVSLGWHMVNPGTVEQVLNHNGRTGGFRSEIHICAGKKLAVVVLCNSGKEENASTSAKELLQQLMNFPVQ